jgi:hypothetical protein
METAVRILINKAVVLDTLEMTGQAFVGSTSQIIAFSESLIKMAGDLDTLRGYAETYYDKFYSDGEKQVRLQSQLSGIFADMDLILPGAREGYRSLLEGLNLTTESGRKAYVTLLQLSESADAYYSYLEEAAKSVLSQAENNVKTAYDAEKTRLTDIYNTQLTTMNANLDSINTIVSELKGGVDKLKNAKEKMRLEDVAYTKREYFQAQQVLQSVLAKARFLELRK